MIIEYHTIVKTSLFVYILYLAFRQFNSLSDHLSIDQTVWSSVPCYICKPLSIYPELSDFPPFLPVSQLVSLSVNQSVCLSVCHSICLSICLSVSLPPCWSVQPSVCMPTSQSACLSFNNKLLIYLFIYLSVCLSVLMSVHPSVFLSVSLSICIHLSV